VGQFCVDINTRRPHRYQDRIVEVLGDPGATKWPHLDGHIDDIRTTDNLSGHRIYLDDHRATTQVGCVEHIADRRLMPDTLVFCRP